MEAVGRRIQTLSWSKTVNWYPQVGDSESADIAFRTPDHIHGWNVEVLTNTNNTEQWLAKWDSFRKDYRRTFWVFEDRSTMCSFFNALHDRGVYDMDGGRFSHPYSNWSPQAVNRKIWRSRNPNEPYGDAAGLINTITAIVESDMRTFRGWFDEYFAERSHSHPTDR